MNTLSGRNTQLTRKSNVPCAVCRAPKFQLRRRKSVLIPGMQLFLCNDCFESKREPKFAIILRARELVQQGESLKEVEAFLRDYRYVGDEIKATDLI